MPSSSAVIPELGVSQDDVMRTLREPQMFTMSWVPWWEAPRAPKPELRAVVLEVREPGMPFQSECEPMLYFSVKVTLHDGQGQIRTSFDARVLATAAERFEIRAEFRDEAFSRMVEAPAPVSLWPRNDDFHFSASLQDGGWTGSLGMPGQGLICSLGLAPDSGAPECAAYMDDGDREIERVELSEQFPGGVSAAELAADFDRVHVPEARWDDGSTTSFRLTATPVGYGCVARAAPPREDPAAEVQRVAVPVELSLESADGRVRLTLPAAVHATDASSDFRRESVLKSVLVPADHQLLADTSLGISPEPSGLNLFQVTLVNSAVSGTAHQGALGFQWYPTPESSPPYPEVLETSIQRARCWSGKFGTPRTFVALNGAEREEP